MGGSGSTKAGGTEPRGGMPPGQFRIDRDDNGNPGYVVYKHPRSTMIVQVLDKRLQERGLRAGAEIIKVDDVEVTSLNQYLEETAKKSFVITVLPPGRQTI